MAGATKDGPQPPMMAPPDYLAISIVLLSNAEVAADVILFQLKE